jgi:3-hydroxybutyryl-CoA dehydrogenase
MDLTGLDVSHPVMESIYHQYYEEPAFRPSVITAQRLAGGLGAQDGEGFYRYTDGTAQQPPSPPRRRWTVCRPCGCRPAPRRAELYQLLKNLGADIETGPHRPLGPDLVAPLGFDVTTVAVVERLDPARTVGIDMLIDDAATKRRVLATNPATRATCAMRRTRCSHATASPSVIRDSGGFVTQRVVATIVNIAADICQQRICTPRTWRPPSPWAWATRWARWPWATAGPTNAGGAVQPANRVRRPRYRPSPWLRRRGASA